jgi:hypothetical protein
MIRVTNQSWGLRMSFESTTFAQIPKVEAASLLA